MNKCKLLDLHCPILNSLVAEAMPYAFLELTTHESDVGDDSDIDEDDDDDTTTESAGLLAITCLPLVQYTQEKHSNLTTLSREINESMSEQHFANIKRSPNGFIPGRSPWLAGKWLSNHVSKDTCSGIHPGLYLVICLKVSAQENIPAERNTDSWQ